MHINLRIIKIILKSIQYRNKELLLALIKAELISSSGYLTELAMIVNPKKYHRIQKLFSRVKFDYVGIQIKIIVMILLIFKITKVSISIDDSIVYRSRKKKVPNGHNQFEHAQKANRSSFVFGQKWLAFGLIIRIGGITITLPLFIYLVKPKKNLISTTIVIQKLIKDVIKRKGLSLEVEILTDSWFARGRLILRAKHRYNFSTISMARKDLVICKIPEVPKKKKEGRPKKYGDKIQPKLEDLSQGLTLFIYGKEVNIKYKEVVAKARFLKGEVIKAVWVSFDESQSLRLLIATDTELSAEEIIKRYAQRWDIESMFNELKNRFRFKDIMMHTSQSYYQFLYFKIWCFIIIKLSSIKFKSKIKNYIEDFLPWRVHHKKGVTITAGSTKLALRGVFSTLHMGLFSPKVDKNIDGTFKDNAFIGFSLDGGYALTG
ncbi:MAG: Unknown protein [uncultured Sulfurovum sp.]|uniref:Transposase IS4-like domain-containing protein n=1 Tax=uncultured Sulfurovum sp. TaxID=269237 RepID=A0A6S6U1X9_9BACT|nr:MAG: Unknown protein [uncultured Sulfurovum sp.]